MINNKVYDKVRYFLVLFFVVCLILFNNSCGLEVFYEVVAPKQIGDMPEIENDSPDRQFFRFEIETKSSNVQEGFNFTGTDVYYKIYTNKDDWEKEKSDLINYSTNNPSGAADKLIGASGYGYSYQKLKKNKKYDDTLVLGTNKKVIIRLTDYYENDLYKASIKISGEQEDIPVRYNNKSFNFGRLDFRDKPSVGDLDLKGDSLPSDNKWIVCMFAVSNGHDNAFTPYYSKIVYLGSVTIDGDKRDN